MLKRIKICLVISCLSASLLFAQKTFVYQDPLKAYKDGLYFFDQKNYITAKLLFQQAIDLAPEIVGNKQQTIETQAKFYAAFSALELFQPDAEQLMLDLMSTYQETPLKRLGYYHLGRYYFRTRKYSNALEWFEKVDIEDLNNEEIAEYKFQIGYSYFYKKKFKEAEKYFNEVKNIPNKYYYPANYYYGYVSFENQKYDQALASFDKIKDSKVYQKIIPYYISQVYYFKGQYDELIDYLTPLINDKELKYYRELNQILGQAYFKMGEYDKAIRYLTVFITNSSKVTKEDIYRLGFAHYKNGDYKEAILQFEQLDNYKDTLGQNSLYVLGDCYLKTGNKSNALSAFRKASEMNFDPRITEQALFNYAKLSYELGLDQEAIATLQAYLEQYNNSENAEEAKELLSELFLNTKNFVKALSVIQSIQTKSPKVKKAYQEVSYYRGIELFNDKEYTQAIEKFNTSLENPINDEIKGLSYFWKGEAYFQLKNYEEAATQYAQFLDLAAIHDFQDEEWYKANALYGAGYSHIKQAQYRQAAPLFNQAVSISRTASHPALKNRILPDALLRAADSRFMIKDYDGALAAYNEVAERKWPNDDYALYQKGVIQGLLGKYEEKIVTMQQLANSFPNSLNTDDALYEIGTTYITLGKNQSAIQAFQKVVADFPNSAYLTKSHLKLGLIYYNENNIQAALEHYRAIIERFPQSQDAKQALLGIKDISIAEGNPDLYLDIAKKTPGLQVTVSAQDSILYLAAESQFINGKYEEAVTKFSNYLDQFENGFFKLHAYFYRGESYFNLKKYSEAEQDYEYVINEGYSRFLEKALAKASKIAFEINKDYEKANRYFKMLIEHATFQQNLYSAKVGLMRTAYLLENYEEAAKYARAILESGESQPEHITEAQYYLGKINFLSKDYEAAIPFLQKASLATNARASEAKYLLAEISYLRGNYEKSAEECFTLIEQKPTYEYWRVKTFILLADNYYQLGNLFQAKATLQSIVDNYEGEELRQIAKEKLDKIIIEEKQVQTIEIVEDTNANIEVDTTESIELVVPEGKGEPTELEETDENKDQ